MHQSLGDLLPYTVPVALSPLPIIAVVMLLLAPAGVRGGLGFLAGRIGTLAAVALVAAALAGLLDGADGGDEKRGWLRIGLGLLLVAGSVAVLRRDRRAGDAGIPRWLQSIDRATPAGALRLGAMLTVVNLKELAFAVGAGLLIGGAGLAAGQALALALVFAGFGALGVAVPVFTLILAGEPARARLAGVRDWLIRNQAIAVAVVLLVLGAMLIGSGIEALSPPG